MAHKFPVPTYPAYEFMNARVCGKNDVKKVLFSLWFARAMACKYFDCGKYFDTHLNSKVGTIYFISRMIIAKTKCLRMANRFGTVKTENF